MKPTNTSSLDKLATETLPFTVRIASQHDLRDVAELRANAYSKHLPELGAKLRQPEESDYELGCEVMTARSKLDGSLLGSLRTHSNVFKPLPLQASVRLPARYQTVRMVETTRLCVQGSPNSSLVRNALFKALYQYCRLQNVDWMMAVGRRPVDRIYDALLFSDVGEPGKFSTMAHVGGIPHRVMSLSPEQALESWKACDHPLFKFVIQTHHPDIDLSKSANLNFAWACPEMDDDLENQAASLSWSSSMSRYDFLSTAHSEPKIRALESRMFNA